MKEKMVLPGGLSLEKRRWGPKIIMENLLEGERQKLDQVQLPPNIILDDPSIMFDFKKERGEALVIVSVLCMNVIQVHVHVTYIYIYMMCVS